MKAKTLHRKLDQYAQRFCPLLSDFPSGYHWSRQQLEYATDLVFKRARTWPRSARSRCTTNSAA